jgi:hypothetical protein
VGKCNFGLPGVGYDLFATRAPEMLLEAWLDHVHGAEEAEVSSAISTGESRE